MQKLISSLLVILILFNFIFCNNAYAVDDQEKTDLGGYGDPVDVKGIDTKIITGEDEKGDSFDFLAFGTSGIAMVIGILARILNVLIALQVDLIMGIITTTTEINAPTATEINEFWFSIDRCVFNRVPLFNINYFNTYKEADDSLGTYTVGDISIQASAGNAAIKESVTKVYYICRILALVISLLVLIYIGIRMAISTVASDKAKYKKMLVSWVESIVILFVTLYIASFIIMLSEQLTGMFYNIRCQILGEEGKTFETVIRENTFPALFSKSGFDLATWSIIYWCLIILEVKFFCAYARRFLMVGLLITVSPLIIITYSIDKAGDGKAQVFNRWLKEILISILIQPLHALIYLIFVITANEIAASSPLVALALLLSITTVEKMVRVIFDMKDSEIVREMKFLKRGK